MDPQLTVAVTISLIVVLIFYYIYRRKDTEISAQFRPHTGENAVITNFQSGAIEFRFQDGTDLVSMDKVEIRFQERPPLQYLLSSDRAFYKPYEVIRLNTPGAYIVQFVQGEVSMGGKTASLVRSVVVVIGDNWPEPVDMLQDPS